MSKVVDRRPAEEITRCMVNAALAETRRIMLERGVTEHGVTFEFMSHAIDRLWAEEDLEGMRSKAHALVSEYIDGLFTSIGEKRPEVAG